MNVIPFVHEGLGNSSYLVQVGEAKAALIDPDRTVGRYLEAARSRGWDIVSIFETHLHADFVSGALEAAHVTEAELYLPAEAEATFPHTPLRPGQKTTSGDIHISAIASPGHTPEHFSYLFTARESTALFSGGALIVGGAARTDLISPEMTEPLTRAQFSTLRTSFSSLADETLLFPTHGGGSFCSTGGGGERTSTLGAERASNPLLLIDDEDEFARWFPSTFPPGVPDYFYRMRPINQAGPRLTRDLPKPRALTPAEFDSNRGSALIVDVRPYEEFAQGHIPGSINNTFRDAFATFLGWVVPQDSSLLFIAGSVPIERIVEESLLVGHERLIGLLDGGLEAWTAAGLPVESDGVVDAQGARQAVLDGVTVVDVREPNEYESGHIEGAINLPVGLIEGGIDLVPRDRPVLAYCGHGERASTALSLLERAGIGPRLNLSGGVEAWKGAGYTVV